MEPAPQHPRLRHLLKKWPALFVVVTLCALFFVPSWGRTSGRVSSYGQDLAHYPLFAIIAAVMLFLWPRHRSAVAKAGVVSGAAVSLALLIELFQPLAGRSAAIGDILLGTAGCFSVVAVYLGLRTASDRARRWLVATAVILLLVSVLPLLMMLGDRWSARRAFPVIDSFERPVELGRWVTEGCVISQSTDHVTHGRYALRLEVTPGAERYPSAFIADGVMDWRGYQRLLLDVYLERGGSRILWVRADDRDNPPYHERAQVAVEIKAGANRIAIDVPAFARLPGGRQLDLGHIITLGVFLDGAEPGDVLYLDHLTLSGRARIPPTPPLSAVAAPAPGV